MKKLILVFSMLMIVGLGSFMFAQEKSINNSKAIVIFYSLHGTTKTVAQEIQKETSGTLFEVKMVKPYTQDDREISKIAKEERSTNNLPAIVMPLPNISQYDVVFIGGPVWSGTLATPLMSYLSQTNFSGKTVIPFWTDEGAPGNYEADFKKQVSKGKVAKGLGLSRVYSISSSNLTKQIKDWISKLNIKNKLIRGEKE